MPVAKLPSLQLIVDEMVRSALTIPSVQASVARLDAALAKHLEAGAGVVEITPRDIDPDGSYLRDTQFLLNVLPKGFAELSARKPDGTLLQGEAFMQMFVRAARANRDGIADPEASDTAVFYRVDLNVLRAAADASTMPTPVRRRAQP